MALSANRGETGVARCAHREGGERVCLRGQDRSHHSSSARADRTRRVSANGRVVIVGGGFAGLAAAARLAGAPVEVQVVDQHNFHTFQPLLYQVATAGLDAGDVAYPIRTIVRGSANTRFVHGRVSNIDLIDRTVGLEDGTLLPYEYLIVASGATAAFFGVPGADEHALSLYTLDDARWVRNKVLAALEYADGHPSKSGSGAALVVVVGGGPTGVETAGALSELLDITIRHDRLHLDPDRSRVVLLDARERLLPSFSPKASIYVEEELRSRGVEVRLGSQVASVSPTGVSLIDGSEIATTMVIWVAGVTVNGTLASTLPGARGPGGRVAVEPDLSLLDHSEVFVVGDAATVRSSGVGPREDAGGGLDKEGTLCPQVAQVAIQSGDHAARQILNRLAGREGTGFVYRDRGVIATVGRRAAVAQLRDGLMVSGTLGWLAWLVLHLMYLIGFRNRYVVLVNWTWSYFRWPSGPRIIVGDVASSGAAAVQCPECRSRTS